MTVAVAQMMPKPGQLEEINRLVESGKVKVRVATVLPLAAWAQNRPAESGVVK